jgi:hypothetical protein
VLAPRPLADCRLDRKAQLHLAAHVRLDPSASRSRGRRSQGGRGRLASDGAEFHGVPCILILAARITLAHFSVSSAMSFAELGGRERKQRGA